MKLPQELTGNGNSTVNGTSSKEEISPIPALYPEVLPNYSQLLLYFLQKQQIPGIWVDLSFIVLAILASEISKQILLNEMRYSITRRMLMDFISSAESCFVSWEIFTIFTIYGPTAFYPLIFLNLIQKSYRSTFYTGVSCPYTHVITYVASWRYSPQEYAAVPMTEIAMRIFAQCMGGIWSYRLNQSAWNFSLTPTHWYTSYYTSYGVCWTFLNVPGSVGFFIELAGTFICMFASDLIYGTVAGSKLATFIKIMTHSAVTTGLVFMAFYYTGGFFHPIIATMRTYGCRGYFRYISAYEHFFVYWLGPTIGALLSFFLAKPIKYFLCSPFLGILSLPTMRK